MSITETMSLDDVLQGIKQRDGHKTLGDMTVVDFHIEENGVWMENAHGHCIWLYGKTLGEQGEDVNSFVSFHLDK